MYYKPVKHQESFQYDQMNGADEPLGFDNHPWSLDDSSLAENLNITKM